MALPAEQTIADVLLEKGLSKREMRDRAQEGRVFLGLTPTTDIGRRIGSYEVHVFADRPRHAVGRDPVVVFRDPHLCIVYKPSGFLSVPAPGRREPSVVRAVERWFGGAFTVHRIDEGTSGLLLVALTESVQVALKALFEVHDIERSYLALVRGAPRTERTTIRSLLVDNRGDGKKGSGTGPDAKLAITHLTLCDTYHDVSLVQATLETGRTHQVRIHLSEAGHPILGDTLYGGPRFARLALHAAVLGFRHPVTGERHRFESPLPDELARAAQKSFPRSRTRG